MSEYGSNFNMACVCDEKDIWTIGVHAEDSDGREVNSEVEGNSFIDCVEELFSDVMDQWTKPLEEPEEEKNETLADYIDELIEENQALQARVDELEAKLVPIKEEDTSCYIWDYFDKDNIHKEQKKYDISEDDKEDELVDSIMRAFDSLDPSYRDMIHKFLSYL